MQACSRDAESDVQGRAPFWTLIWETADVPPPHGPLLSCQDHRYSHHWATFLWLRACFLKVAIIKGGEPYLAGMGQDVTASHTETKALGYKMTQAAMKVGVVVAGRKWCWGKSWDKE